jgi:hypothetical protein
MGSWNTIAISLPLIERISSGAIKSKSDCLPFLPVKWISPLLYIAGGTGSNCRTASEVTDFPEPDSPTMATTSPLFTVKEILLIAEVDPSSD